MSEFPIKWWAGEYWFLDNSYECPIVFQNLAYPSVSHAFTAAQSDKLDTKIRIAHSPLIALKKIAEEEQQVSFSFGGPNDMRKMLEYKFGYQENTSNIHMSLYQASAAKKLLATGMRPLIYGNRSCSTFYGRCECPKHANGEGKNVLGGLIMGVRARLLQYVTSGVNPDQTCSCESRNEAFFLYSNNGKLWLKPFCKEHQALAGMTASKLDVNAEIFRFEKNWFPKKKDDQPTNKIVVPHHHQTIRPDVFTQHDDGEDEEWKYAWGVYRRPVVDLTPEQKLPKNITFYLSGRIS